MNAQTTKFVGSLLVATYLGVCIASLASAQDPEHRKQKGTDDKEMAIKGPPEKTRSEGISDEDIRALGEARSEPYLKVRSINLQSDSALTSDEIDAEFPRYTPSREALECLRDLSDDETSSELESVAYVIAIAKDGTTERVDISKIETSTATAECIRKDLETLSFSPSDGPSRATVIFEYDPAAVPMGGRKRGLGMTSGTKHRPIGVGKIGKAKHASDQSSGDKVDAEPGSPEVQGSLDKEIIRKVVRQHRREIKYCYEKELQKDADLEGDVLVKFTISATGNVVAALIEKDTMNNDAVTSCIQAKIRRWVFPEPKGGGIVVVRYPFEFSAE